MERASARPGGWPAALPSGSAFPTGRQQRRQEYGPAHVVISTAPEPRISVEPRLRPEPRLLPEPRHPLESRHLPDPRHLPEPRLLPEPRHPLESRHLPEPRHVPEPRVPVEHRIPVESAAPECRPGDVIRVPPEIAASLPLQTRDRVCWISDTGPEFGTVGWIGKLPAEDAGRDWMVGVEFDNAVGSGNGCYRGHRLFAARLNHASIVPITGLMRAEDLRPPTPELVSVTREPNFSSRMRNLEAHTSSDEEERRSPTPPVPARPQGSFTDDLRHMSAFHRMAYEQLTEGRTPPQSVAERSCDQHDHAHQSKPSLISRLSPEGRNRRHTSLTDPSNSQTVGRSQQHPPSLADVSNSHTVPVRRPARRKDRPQPRTPSPEPSSAVDILNEVEAAWTDPDMTVGSAVEVDIQGMPQYGVIRWIGTVRGDAKKRVVAGVEMEEDDASTGGDGTFYGVRYFTCPPGKALFVPLVDCSRDRRFLDVPQETHDSNAFGSVECPVITGDVAPIAVTSGDELRKLCGKPKGIQGHLNSCYLDATLFSMFAFTPVLDCLLHRPPRPGDIPEYAEVQRLLKEEIVNPLRSAMFVRADRVMKLRQMLETLSSVRGLTSEEKDPEEFLQSLLAQMLHADPFLRYSSGQESYLYQLIVERDDRLVLPSVQQLFDQSFISGDIKLKEIPSCLIVQMPRFGKDYKMYSRILPSMVLDVTDVIENSPRQCFVCGRLAEWECKDCFDQGGLGLITTAFCTKCNLTSHSHQSRSSHCPRQPLNVPRQFSDLREHAHITRCFLELFAVVCIHTSHYVAFTKTGCGPDAHWVFFDSMADRKGEANGYNIPEMTSVPDLPRWLTEEGRRGLLAVPDDRRLPEHARRLLCDGYMCFYQSRDVMMYR